MSTLIHDGYYNSPIGWMHLQADDSNLLVAGFMDRNPAKTDTTTTSTVLKKAIQQLDAYFKGTLLQFHLPLHAEGTAFQQSVWQELIKIPLGTTVTYLQMAKRLGNVKSIRAAATANGKNPIGIIIPCHRVIGADGKLTGYAGGLHRKQWLLEHEAKITGTPSLF